MSMHKTPLTPLEEAGFRAHGLQRHIGKPSQLADVFRQGIAWGLRTAAAPAVAEQEPARTPARPALGTLHVWVDDRGKKDAVVAIEDAAVSMPVGAHELYAAPSTQKVGAAQEPALWQFRWLNPGDDPRASEEQLAWHEVKPWNPRMQTLEQRIEELRAFEFNGRPAYEVRALFAGPAPSQERAAPQDASKAPAAEPCRPDLLEKLTYHQFERDDLTLDEVQDVLALGWRNVPDRTERQMLLQLLALMAAAPPAADTVQQAPEGAV